MIKNYTSAVPAHRTVGQIEQLLIQSGVSGITKLYGSTGEVLGLTFTIQLTDGPGWTIRLPSDVDRCQQALWMEYVGKDRRYLNEKGDAFRYHPQKRKNRQHFRAQAEMTSWRILHDWMEIELTKIKLGQVDFRQAFITYVWDGRQTFFERLNQEGFKGLLQ